MIEPLVTIGIPVYNCERFISLAIKSVLKQTYKNFELIVTDDGSTDGTMEELNKFDDPRLKVISDGKNRGISYRLNQQIELAQGQYFCRMDGDDIMFPDRLERQVSYLMKHPSIDVCGSSAVVIGDENEIIGMRDFIEGGKDSECERFNHPTVIGKTEYFKTYKYRDEVKGIEDVDLWIRSRNKSHFICLNSPTLFYRDPLKFKLKTYCFRQQQYRKGLKAWKKLELINNRAYIKAFIITIIKSLLATILTLCGKDKQMIARRNTVCSGSLEFYYNEVLTDLVNSRIV